MSAELQPLVIIFAGLAFLALLYAMKLLADSVPPETAKKLAELVPAEIVQVVLAQAKQRVLQAGLDEAAKTPSDLDDEFWKQISKIQGATVTPLSNGGYTVTISTPPSAKDETLPNAPKMEIKTMPLGSMPKTDTITISSNPHTPLGEYLYWDGIKWSAFPSTTNGATSNPLQFPNTPTNTPK